MQHTVNFKRSKVGKPAMVGKLANGIVSMLLISYLFMVFYIWSAFMLDLDIYLTMLLLIMIPNIIKSYTITLNSTYYRTIIFVETIISIVVLLYIFCMLYKPIFLNIVSKL